MSSYNRHLLQLFSLIKTTYKVNAKKPIYCFLLPNRYVHITKQLNYTAKEKQARDAIKKFSKKSQLKPVTVNRQMTVGELANAMQKPSQHIFDCMAQIGFQVRNRRDSFMIADFDLIIKIVQMSGFRYQMSAAAEVNYEKLLADLDVKDDCLLKRNSPSSKSLIRRPPVVTIMGHVDHGKTTLLDALRGSNVVASEFGGITQHIGAFNCRLKNQESSIERSITFLDTPGHAAFSLMRSRGAKVTDIVVLVIAAEDSIMAQTIESIQHAKNTGCTIIVAINKIDKCSEQQINKVKQDLLKYELIPEEMGGDVQVVPISALKKLNLDLLKEEIWTRAEIMELTGDPKGLAEGYIIESSIDAHKGKLATVLIKRGTVKRGSFLVAGSSWCKVKFIHDENAESLNQATLSQAVQIMGWKEMPSSGDEVLEVSTEHRAKEIVEIRLKKSMLEKQRNEAEIIKKKREQHNEVYLKKLKEKRESGSRFISSMYNKEGILVENLDIDSSSQTDMPKLDPAKKLHIIIKTDVNGSLEAILNVLETYNSHDKVILDVVHFEVGQIKKGDLEMAETFEAIIYCFNLPPVTEDLKDKKLKIKSFNVIYKLFDDLKLELNNLAPLTEQEEVKGEAKLLKLFKYDETNKTTITVAGSLCTEGMIDKNSKFKIMRGNEVIAASEKCKSLKHIKTNVNTVKRNVEFGISFENAHLKLEPGDKLICYDIKMIQLPIEWNLGF